MKYLDQTMATPQANLALDEALLDLAEAGRGGELLRFWEPQSKFVVLGHSNHVDCEVHRQACDALTVPILRRCSGGGAVLQAPGCLNYAVILRIEETGPTATITSTNHYVMGTHRALLQNILSAPVEVLGHTDLALRGRKFSGNAQRRKRHYLLFHGSFLLSMDLHLMERLLPVPSRQPAYRQQRSHRHFVLNLALPPDQIKQALKSCWRAQEPFEDLPHTAVENLVASKYSRDEWNLQR